MSKVTQKSSESEGDSRTNWFAIRRQPWLGPGQIDWVATVPDVLESGAGGDSLHGMRARLLRRLRTTHIRLQSMRSHGNGKNSQVRHRRCIFHHNLSTQTPFSVFLIAFVFRFRYWANVDIPHGTIGFQAICPFCATPLLGCPGYLKLIFQDNLD